MWKGLCLITNSESPIVVVLSYVHTAEPQHIAVLPAARIVHLTQSVVRWSRRSTVAISFF